MENNAQNKILQNSKEIKTEIIEQIKTKTTNNNENLKEWQDEEKKENKKKALLQTFSVYALELKNLSDEIFKQTEKMERYLDYYIKYAFADDLFNLSKKNPNDGMYLTTLSKKEKIAQTRKYSRMAEKIFLKSKKRALNRLQENLKSKSNTFIIIKIQDLIEKIKNSKKYLNNIKFFSNKLIKYDEKYENLNNITGIKETLNENNKDEIPTKEDIFTQNEFEKENYKYFDFLNLKKATKYFDIIFGDEEKNEKGEFLKYYLNIFDMQIKNLDKLSTIMEKLNNGYNLYDKTKFLIIYQDIDVLLKAILNNINNHKIN